MDGDEQVPILERIIGDDQQDAGGRINAAYGLATRGHASGIEFLIEQSESDSLPADLKPVILPTIVMLADKVPPESILPFLNAQVLPDASVDRLYLCIGALGKVGDRSSLDALEAIVASGQPGSIKDQAKKVINEIEGYTRYEVR